MSEHSAVIIERDGALAVVTLNRPSVRNAFNAELRQAFAEAVAGINADPAIRVVVLKGAGAGFCAGADLTEPFAGSITEQIEAEYKPFLTGIAEADTIWIASVHGAAAGIGGALAMACDLMVMAEDASIYLAFAAIGLIPDGGATWQLINAMGYRRAFETIIEGRRIAAAECLAHGLANRLAPREHVHDEALAWARSLVAGSPLAQKAAKRVLRHVGRMRLADAITLEARKQQALVESEDFRDAVDAFFAKRKPTFHGR